MHKLSIYAAALMLSSSAYAQGIVTQPAPAAPSKIPPAELVAPHHAPMLAEATHIEPNGQHPFAKPVPVQAQPKKADYDPIPHMVQRVGAPIGTTHMQDMSPPAKPAGALTIGTHTIAAIMPDGAAVFDWPSVCAAAPMGAIGKKDSQATLIERMLIQAHGGCR